MEEQGEFRPASASLPVIVIYTLSSLHSNVIPDYQPSATQTAFHAQTLLKASTDHKDCLVGMACYPNINNTIQCAYGTEGFHLLSPKFKNKQTGKTDKLCCN